MGEIFIPRRFLSSKEHFITPATGIVEDDCKIYVLLESTLKNHLEPRNVITCKLKASPDDFETVVGWGAIKTYGSSNKTTARRPPFFAVNAPPAGWKVRAKLVIDDKPVSCGVLIRSLTGPRKVKHISTHHSVAYDNSDDIYGATGAQIVTPNFLISGTERCIIVGATDDQTGASLQSCSGAGATWASLGQATQNRAAYLWKGLAPSTDSQAVTGTWDTSDNFEQGLVAANFTGVDQTTPTSDTNTNTGTDAAATVTIANVVTGDYVMDCVATYALNTTPPYDVGGGQTGIWCIQETDGRGGSSIQPGSAGGVMSWTLFEGANWAIIATRIRQGVGGEPVTSISWLGETQVVGPKKKFEATPSGFIPPVY